MKILFYFHFTYVYFAMPVRCLVTFCPRPIVSSKEFLKPFSLL